MKREWWQYALLVVLALLAVWIIAGILSSRSPDAELARTVREALRMTRQAHQEADAVRRASSAFRLIAMAVGMAAPLVIVYLIYRLHMRPEPQSPDMLNAIERERLEAREDERPELPSPALSLPKEPTLSQSKGPALRLPEETTEAKEADQD
jgi:heme/copper-type cytochrome/quinol oxidase subunit 4